MKILKYVLLLLLVLIVAGAIFVATRPNDYDVVRSKVIKAPIDVVFNNINDYKNWEAWGPWMEEDSTIVVKYNEQTSGVGANYTWTSKDGPGKMKTVSLTQNKSLEQVMQFGDYEPTDVYWTFEEVPEGTKVSWGMKSDKTAFMFKLFAALSGGMDKMLGDMEEKGLANIEREVLAELKKNPPKQFRLGDISQHEASAKQFIGFYQKTTTDASMEDMTKLFTEFMPQAGMYAVNNKLEGYTPGSLYIKWDEETKEAEFYIGLLFDDDTILPDGEGMTKTILPAGQILKISKFGPYGVGDMDAHMKIATYMNEKKLMPEGIVWELYPNDPTTVKPEEIQTDIFYLVKAAE
ncbi:SRPBCC family protein [Kordia sp. YSTF-M3]|uniref:SRPBCC family protein n=1 Tax=Kordia aestuariivivens TaxID=2759037 RepID=A0ABR7QDJ5_9FLAO|nr:SRPBCC family protein [Kordia aestuariivivens]MBC8756629.1 SRPBCC family protein [Kordia aestuariivivens]